jgi:hypothetical protein
MSPLFNSNFGTDDKELASLLASPNCGEVLNFIESLWRTYYPIVGTEENAFRGDLRAQPYARLWEMYLAVALGNSGFDLAKKRNEGPDVQLRNPTVWVEAVVSTDGAKGNNNGIQPGAEVPEILLSESGCGGPPEDAIILRCLSSVDAKLKKLNGYRDSKGNDRLGYVDKGIVKETEPYVVALNIYKTSFAQLDHQYTPNHIPTIVKALFGYGESVFLSGRGSSNRIDYIYRPHVTRTQVRTDIFFQDEYSGVSALIVSKEGYWSWRHRIPASLSETFILVHNPLAENPLPKLWLNNGHELWIEQGELHKRIWKDGGEHLIESFPLPIGWVESSAKRT